MESEEMLAWCIRLAAISAACWSRRVWSRIARLLSRLVASRLSLCRIATGRGVAPGARHVAPWIASGHSARWIAHSRCSWWITSRGIGRWISRSARSTRWVASWLSSRISWVWSCARLGWRILSLQQTKYHFNLCSHNTKGKFGFHTEVLEGNIDSDPLT